MSFFFRSKRAPTGVVIRNVLGGQIDRLDNVWELARADFRGRERPHVDLSGMPLDDTNLEGANLSGANLVRASFCRAILARAEISFANAESADFRDADLPGTIPYQSETWRCKFDGSLMNGDSHILGRKVFEPMRVNG